MHDNRNSNNPISTFMMGAITALAVGGFLFFGSKNSRKNRQKLDWWLEDAKEELTNESMKVKDITQDKFYEIVDKIVAKYNVMKKTKDDKIEDLREDLRNRWEDVQKAVDNDED